MYIMTIHFTLTVPYDQGNYLHCSYVHTFEEVSEWFTRRSHPRQCTTKEYRKHH